MKSSYSIIIFVLYKYSCKILLFLITVFDCIILWNVVHRRREHDKKDIKSINKIIELHESVIWSYKILDTTERRWNFTAEDFGTPCTMEFDWITSLFFEALEKFYLEPWKNKSERSKTNRIRNYHRIINKRFTSKPSFVQLYFSESVACARRSKRHCDSQFHCNSVTARSKCRASNYHLAAKIYANMTNIS